MFIKDLPKDFYKAISGKRPLILVNFDIDAICASRILQALFKNDSISYTLVPVQGVQDMVRAYEENAEEVTFVIMVNCGGTLDIVELLRPEEHVTFFILDSHRPYDLCNVHSDRQIQILGEPTPEDNIPEYDEVFCDDSSEDEEDESDEENETYQAKRRKIMENKLKKQAWEKKRDDIVFNYSQFSYYGKSSAVLVYEMTWQMSRDNLDMLWWATIGSAEQNILKKVELSANLIESDNLRGHVSRLTHARAGDLNNQQLSDVKIIFDNDLQLPLYRHWTVEDSLRHSMLTAVKLKLWSIKGEDRLKKFLAEMGLPLEQSKQQFSAMDLSLRQEFKQMVEQLSEKYSIHQIFGASFTMQHGYRFKYSSSDIVYAMMAVLESTNKDRSPHKCFLEASECLSRTNHETLKKAVERAKNMLIHIHKTAQSILEMRQVINTGTFLYIALSEGILRCHQFSHPHALTMLAQFVLRAYVENSKHKNAKNWPLVASAMYSEEDKTCLILGIPPVSEDQPKSLFGPAFEQTAKNVNSRLEADYFDSTIARLKVEDRQKFIDALTALLAA